QNNIQAYTEKVTSKPAYQNHPSTALRGMIFMQNNTPSKQIKTETSGVNNPNQCRLKQRKCNSYQSTIRSARFSGRQFCAR
ncbi:hypothetical protein OAL43_02705, partial [bacterium]|nr:hypothetical protein [bacterium]